MRVAASKNGAVPLEIEPQSISAREHKQQEVACNNNSNVTLAADLGEIKKELSLWQVK